MKSRDVFYRELQEINAFYASSEGLQRSGGMIIDRDGVPTADIEAMGAWGYDLLAGASVEQIRLAIRRSEEWLAKHPPTIAVPSRLRIAGKTFVNEAGQAVPLRSHSFFVGLLRHRLGEDVRPALRYAREATASNCVRVFVMMHFVPAALGLPDLVPSDALTALPSFLELAAAEGLYVDVTAGDAQVLMPDVSAQQQYFAAVGAVMLQYQNAAVLTLNEPWKNGLDPFRSLERVPPGVLRARGAAADEAHQYEPPLEFYDPHTERSLGDEGYKWVRHQWEAKDWPGLVYLEEPMGCADYAQDGRRDNDPDRHAQAAVVGEIVGAGYCFHPEYGMYARIPEAGSQQDVCARAVGAARRWFLPEAQQWMRTRAGWADSAVILDDAHALRVYQRLGARRGQAVAVRPRGYVPRAQNGWSIVAVRDGGAFIDLER